METPKPRQGRELVEAGDDVNVAEIHELWRQCPPERRPRRHPCGPLVAAWHQHAPVKVPYVQGKHALILTRQVAQVEDTAERFYLSRFGAAAHRQPATRHRRMKRRAADDGCAACWSSAASSRAEPTRSE